MHACLACFRPFQLTSTSQVARTLPFIDELAESQVYLPPWVQVQSLLGQVDYCVMSPEEEGLEQSKGTGLDASHPPTLH